MVSVKKLYSKIRGFAMRHAKFITYALGSAMSAYYMAYPAYADDIGTVVTNVSGKVVNLITGFITAVAVMVIVVNFFKILLATDDGESRGYVHKIKISVFVVIAAWLVAPLLSALSTYVKDSGGSTTIG